MRTALVTGAHGQDGSYLVERLGRDGYRVVGLGREAARELLDPAAVRRRLDEDAPDEVYHLAAHHRASEERAALDDAVTFEASHATHVRTLVNLLDAMRDRLPGCRLFYAASSHVFGAPTSSPQHEGTVMDPRTIYGITKRWGLEACRYYRETHGLFACAGILYNHESPRRGPAFVTRKITRAAAAISSGEPVRLEIGRPDAVVDWGFAPDYVEAMHRMLLHSRPDDFVVATGTGRTVRDFLDEAFGRVGLDWHRHVVTGAAEAASPPGPPLVGDPAKISREIGWQPRTSFSRMVALMIDSDLEAKRASSAGQGTGV